MWNLTTRKWLHGLLLLLAVLASNYASATVPPEQVIMDASERMLNILRTEGNTVRKDKERIYALIEEIILPHIDIEKMSRWVLGKHWRKATPEQRTQFAGQFRILLMRTYATAMTEYSGQSFNYLPLRANPGDADVVVKTELKQPGGYPIPISYSLYLANSEWKVYDVTIDGISLVGNYRTSFSAQIKRSGFEDLINRLAERNQQATSTAEQ